MKEFMVVSKSSALLFVILLLPLPFHIRCAGQDKSYYAVTKVVDGDTFWVADGSAKGLKVRLIGVDAPESRKTGRKEVEYFGRESAEFLTRLLSNRKVRLVHDVGKKDRYGRTLAYVYLEDGTFVNTELIRRGYAQVLTVPPNVRHADEFVRLQAEARRNRRGLWSR